MRTSRELTPRGDRHDQDHKAQISVAYPADMFRRYSVEASQNTQEHTKAVVEAEMKPDEAHGYRVATPPT